MKNPHHELVGREGGPRRIGGLMPKYHLTEGLSSRRVAAWVEAVLPLADQLEEVIPVETRFRHHLLPVGAAVRRAHRPESEAEWQGRRQTTALPPLRAR